MAWRFRSIGGFNAVIADVNAKAAVVSAGVDRQQALAAAAYVQTAAITLRDGAGGYTGLMAECSGTQDAQGFLETRIRILPVNLAS